ncbi:hypothetical protein HDE_14102 [Halotydeus destructor]|nr:hypothetical protein HDE_14102 [Halotydeus destructor]
MDRRMKPSMQPAFQLRALLDPLESRVVGIDSEWKAKVSVCPCNVPAALQKGFDGPEKGPDGLEKGSDAFHGFQKGCDGPEKGPDGLEKGSDGFHGFQNCFDGPEKGSDGPEKGSDDLEKGSDGFDGLEKGSDGLEKGSDGHEKGSDGLEKGSDGRADLQMLCEPGQAPEALFAPSREGAYRTRPRHRALEGWAKTIVGEHER